MAGHHISAIVVLELPHWTITPSTGGVALSSALTSAGPSGVSSDVSQLKENLYNLELYKSNYSYQSVLNYLIKNSDQYRHYCHYLIMEKWNIIYLVYYLINQ